MTVRIARGRWAVEGALPSAGRAAAR
jgi:hypothetical protein